MLLLTCNLLGNLVRMDGISIILGQRRGNRSKLLIVSRGIDPDGGQDVHFEKGRAFHCKRCSPE